MSPATTADHRSDGGPQRIDSRVVPLDYIDVLPYYSFVTLFLCLLSFSPHHVFPLSHAVLCCIVFMPRHCFATLADIFLKLHFCPELDLSLSPPPPPAPSPALLRLVCLTEIGIHPLRPTALLYALSYLPSTTTLTQN